MKGVPIDLSRCAPQVRHAMRVLRDRGVAFQLKTVHQLKVDDLNFYPARGTIFRDGDVAALEQNGLDALISLIAGSSRGCGRSIDTAQRVSGNTSDRNVLPELRSSTRLMHHGFRKSDRDS